MTKWLDVLYLLRLSVILNCIACEICRIEACVIVFELGWLRGWSGMLSFALSKGERQAPRSPVPLEAWVSCQEEQLQHKWDFQLLPENPHANSQQETLLRTELGVPGTEEPGSGNRNLESLIIAGWIYYLVNKSESFWSWTLDCLTFLGWLKLPFKGHRFLINPQPFLFHPIVHPAIPV